MLGKFICNGLHNTSVYKKVQKDRVHKHRHPLQQKLSPFKHHIKIRKHKCKTEPLPQKSPKIRIPEEIGNLYTRKTSTK